MSKHKVTVGLSLFLEDNRLNVFVDDRKVSQHFAGVCRRNEQTCKLGQSNAVGANEQTQSEERHRITIAQGGMSPNNNAGACMCTESESIGRVLSHSSSLVLVPAFWHMVQNVPYEIRE